MDPSLPTGVSNELHQNINPSGNLPPAVVPDRARFMELVRQETELLREIVQDGKLERLSTPRAGAELETWLVRLHDLDPAPLNLELLKVAANKNWVTELGASSIECNLPCWKLEGACFSTMESWLMQQLKEMEGAANKLGVGIVLGGTLPTMRLEHATLDYITEKPRYRYVFQVLSELKGGTFDVSIDTPTGTWRAVTTTDAPAGTACGLQPHLQVSAEDYVRMYNIAQTISGLMVATTVSAPLLFGQEVWQSSRIPLLSELHRGTKFPHDDDSSRFFFGEKWCQTPLDDFEENVNVLPVIEDAGKQLQGDESFSHLEAHASTIWKFNRAKYGVVDGVPHIRIEHRAPDTALSLVDNIANLAWFYGLAIGVNKVYGDVVPRMSFQAAKENLFAGARGGLSAQLHWLDDEVISAEELALRLLPVAEQGLRELKIAKEDIEKYLGIIEARVRSQMTGAKWIVDSLHLMDGVGEREKLQRVVAAIHENQLKGPVHTWPLAQ